MYIKGELTTEHIQALLKNVITTSRKFKSSINNFSIIAATTFLFILFMVKLTFQAIQLSIYLISAILFAVFIVQK